VWFLLLAAPASAQSTLTLAVDKTDVLSGQQVVLSGRVTPVPPPDDPGMGFVRIMAQTPGEDSSDVAVEGHLAPDGTFRLVHKPKWNLIYTATAFVGTGELVSAPVEVYADYVPEVTWRHRSHGRIEAAMQLSVKAEVIDYFDRHFVDFYGFRSKRSRVARRLFRARMFYPRDDSEARASAYVLRHVRGARRIHYVFACVPEPRPDNFGRPDDPIQRGCGHSRLALP
jgi:hypothetical protein